MFKSVRFSKLDVICYIKVKIDSFVKYLKLFFMVGNLLLPINDLTFQDNSYWLKCIEYLLYFRGI